MRYKIEMEIDQARELVIELFLDPDNLAKWQDSLVSIEPVSGEARTAGAKNRQLHKMGESELWITETITVNDYPDKFCATYEGGGTFNLVENYFSDAGDGKTKWVLVSDFRGFGFFMKMMMLFMPGMFKKQSLAFMESFKSFAEGAEKS